MRKEIPFSQRVTVKSVLVLSCIASGTGWGWAVRSILLTLWLQDTVTVAVKDSQALLFVYVLQDLSMSCQNWLAGLETWLYLFKSGKCYSENISAMLINNVTVGNHVLCRLVFFYLDIKSDHRGRVLLNSSMFLHCWSWKQVIHCSSLRLRELMFLVWSKDLQDLMLCSGIVSFS